MDYTLSISETDRTDLDEHWCLEGYLVESRAQSIYLLDQKVPVQLREHIHFEPVHGKPFLALVKREGLHRFSIPVKLGHNHLVLTSHQRAGCVTIVLKQVDMALSLCNTFTEIHTKLIHFLQLRSHYILPAWSFISAGSRMCIQSFKTSKNLFYVYVYQTYIIAMHSNLI